MSPFVFAIIGLAGLSTAALAQNLPTKGTDATFDVGIWNIRNFGNDGVPPDDDLQIANASEVIRQSGVDLWAIQEIEDAEDFDRLVHSLGDGWAGELDRASSNLRVAFVYDADVVQVRRIASVLTPYSSEFAGRPPLQMEADITLSDVSFTALFIVVHMKCCNDDASWDRRQNASELLKTHINSLVSTMPVFVLGDFNDELTTSITSGKGSPYENFLDDAEHFRFLTIDLEASETHTYCLSSSCTSGSTIDHILITNQLFESYIPGSVATYVEVLDTMNGIPSYTATTSDHLPVVASFRFATDTGTESLVDRSIHVRTLYPNPIGSAATLVYSTSAPGQVSIRVVDLLGRQVFTVTDGFRTAGNHRAAIHAAGLPVGAYLIRLQADDSVIVKPFVVLR